MDGALQGRTPLGKDVCAGTHRLQLLHPAGQFVTEVVVRQGQVSKAGGELKPALAFVGIYGGDPAAGSLSPMKAEWEAVARRLALRLTTFGFPQISFDEAEALRRKGSLPVDRLLVRGAGEGEVDSALKRIALETGRADLILLGLRSGDHYAFRLYSVLHPGFDEVGVPNLEEASLDFLVSELNAAAVVSARLRGVDLGLGLVDSAKGLVVMKRGAGRYPETGPIKPGAVIRAADQKKMDLRALEAHLRGAKAGQVMNLEVASGEGASAQVSVQLRQAGTEYPWSTPDGFINSVLTMLSHLREREPLSEEAKYAGLALARGFMQLRDWKRALEILTKTNLEPHKTGICPGTVLYYQGRCYEEMGNQGLARDFYTRAKDYPEGTIGTPDGLSVAVLADRRVQALGSK